MSKDVVIRIRAEDAASPTFKRIASEAQAAGASIERSNQGASRSYEDLQKRATAVGGAIGTLIGGMALAGSAAVNQGRQVDALTRVYKDSADEILRFSKELQDNTNYSDEQARQAALTASTLQKSYGLTTDMVKELIERSADLAQVHGIDLTDAVSRTAAAIRGEAESAELLSITLSDNYVASQAAARGIRGWTTTMDDAERAAFRYQLLLEQTNDVQGAAADASEGARGAMYDLIQSVQDGTVAFGQFLGPAGEALSVLGSFAIGAPVAGAALGKLWAGIGALGGLSALGVYGLPAAAAAGGGFLLWDVIANANTAGNNSADSFFSTFFGGATGALKWATPGGFGDAFLADIQRQFASIPLSNQAEEAFKRMVFGMGQEDAVNDLFAQLVAGGYLPDVDLAEIGAVAASRSLSTPELINQALTQSGWMIYDPASGLFYTRADFVSRQFNLTGNAGMGAGMSYTPPPARIPSNWFPFRGGANPQADYLAYQAGYRDLQAQLDAAFLAALGSGAFAPRDLLRAAYPGSPLNDRLLAGGGLVPDMTNYTRFDVQAGTAGAARAAFQTGFQAVIGQTQGMASDSQGLADLTMELVNEEGVLGAWDDLVSRGVIDLATQQWANYRDIQDDANRIFATNLDIQDDVAVIQLRQIDYLADLQEAYAEQIDAISKMSEEEQRRTLALMDAGQQTKLNEAATIAYRVATGELSEAIGTDLIEGMARADPLFADLAEQYGLIERGADGEIRVIFPEKENLIEGVARLSDEVSRLVDLLANYFNINITSNAPNRAEELAGIVGLLNAIDGQSATYYVNEVRTGISIGSPSGPGFTPGPWAMHGLSAYADGGTVHAPIMPAYANGGTWAMVGERGPEMVYLSRGDQVYNTEASKTMAGNRGGSIVINGPVTVVANDPRQFSQSLREAAIRSART